MKITKIFIIAAIAGSMLAGCSKNNDPATREQGILINGVVWAQCNVDAPGKFADKPEASGMFYQWNRKRAYPTTENVTDWDDTNPAGTAWTAVNDPSPAGWRVPTKAELEKLLDLTKVDIKFDERSGIKGVYFSDKANPNNRIFLPVAGWRDFEFDFKLVGVGAWSGYWSSAQSNDNEAYSLSIQWNSDCKIFDLSTKIAGLSLRCVKK